YKPSSYMADGGNIPAQNTQQVANLASLVQDKEVTLNIHKVIEAIQTVTILNDAGTV
ncbi:unnamed protein product, partial [marine sediment metagenome]